MEMFKSLAKLKNAKIKSESVSKNTDKGTLDMGGRIKISKGCLSAEVGYWARVCDMQYPNCISIEDWNSEDGLKYVTISGVEIDCLDKFTESLTDCGMKSVADVVGIQKEEYEKEVYKDITNHPSVKALFGDCKVWALLPLREQQDIIIADFIEKYITIPNPYMLGNYGVITKDYEGKPTIEQLLQFKKDRIMIINEPNED